MKASLPQTLLFCSLMLSAAPTLAAPGEHFPQTRTRVLSTKEVAALSPAQRRYAINEIYARHGLLFGDMAIRKQFLGMSWYQPQPGRSMAQIKTRFTSLERRNVERLSMAREIENASVEADTHNASKFASYISPYAGTSRALKGELFPETRLERMRPDDIAGMTSAQRRYAINEIMARHGFTFGDMAIRKQFLGFSWYKPRPSLTMSGARAALTSIERANFVRLAAFR